jgi:hypothetical protein
VFSCSFCLDSYLTFLLLGSGGIHPATKEFKVYHFGVFWSLGFGENLQTVDLSFVLV